MLLYKQVTGIRKTNRVVFDRAFHYHNKLQMQEGNVEGHLRMSDEVSRSYISQG